MNAVVSFDDQTYLFPPTYTKSSTDDTAVTTRRCDSESGVDLFSAPEAVIRTDSFRRISASTLVKLGSNMSSNRASSHRCKDPDCSSSAASIKLADGTRHKSKYYACKIGWAGCNRRARTGKDFYLECGKDGCDVKVKGDHLKLRRVPWLCSKHIAPPILPIITKCKADGCSQPQFDDSLFCEDHKCDVDDCSADKWEDTAYCDDHQPCAVRNCRRCAPYNDVEHRPEPYCWGHRRCMTSNCPNVVDRQHNHCPVHECCVGGCKGEKYVWEEREKRNDHCRLR
ncbi:hypothetical protein LIA77_04926 [Sarocladium implicatum]|nr:hypothetical protein LIA77_04926 [Sarocladium implicatum]